MALTPPPAVPQRGDRATFSSRVDAFLTWMANLVGQLTQFIADLTTIAYGGAYTIPYIIRSSTTAVGSAAGGQIALSSDLSMLLVDTKSGAGADVSALLLSSVNSTSAVKAALRITQQNNPNNYIVCNVTGYSVNGTVGSFTISITAINNGLSDGVAVVVSLQRTGDKGDPGNATPVVYVRNQLGNGTAPQTFNANTWNTVQLNNIPYSTIPGITVSNGVISGLPAGTYWVEASSPCFSSGTHQSRLFNVTDGTVIDNGTSERNDSGTPLRVTRSFIRTAFTINSTKAVRIEHWTPLQTTNGSAASSGAGEIYGEIRLLKVS